MKYILLILRKIYIEIDAKDYYRHDHMKKMVSLIREKGTDRTLFHITCTDNELIKFYLNIRDELM